MSTNPFQGKKFVITGSLKDMERKEALRMIQTLGGQTADGPVNTMDYLVVGYLEWTLLNDGKPTSKIEKAISLQNKGMDVKIISEDEFMDMLKSQNAFEKAKNMANQESLSLSAIVEKIENLPESTQLFFKEFLLEVLYHSKNTIGYMTNSHIQTLLDCGLVERLYVVPQDILCNRTELRELLLANNISGFRKNPSMAMLMDFCATDKKAIDVIVNHFICVQLSYSAKSQSRLAYTYLIRKYDTETYLDSALKECSIPKGAKFNLAIKTGGCIQSNMVLEFPDDKVTELLNKYGVNRCKDWVL